MNSHGDDYNYDHEFAGGRPASGRARDAQGDYGGRRSPYPRGGYADRSRRSAPQRSNGRSAGRRPAHKSHAALPRGMGIAAAAMAALLAVALLFQQFGGSVAASSMMTGNIIEGSPIRITEVMSSNASALPDEDGDYPDWIELKNVTDKPVSLAGYLLSDSTTKDKFFPLPDIVVAPGAYMVVFASGKTRAAAGSNIHASFKLSSSGETVYLVDDMSNIMDMVEVPALGSNYSYMRDLHTNEWTATDKYTPGYPNEEEFFEQIVSMRTASDSPIKINEICASNKTIIQDEDGDFSDWIELYNSGAEAVNLKGYALSDTSGKPMKWLLPDVTLESGAYLVVFASGKSRSAPELHANFSLASEKSEVLLCDPKGVILDMVYYDLIPHDGTYARDETGQWRAYMQGTPGYANTQQAMAIFEQSLSARNTTGLFIEEALASSSVESSADPLAYDWLELHNRSDETISLAGYGLSDNPNNPRKWQFPADASIAPGKRMKVYCSGMNTVPGQKGEYGEADGNEYSEYYHTNFRLSHLGEILTLCTPDGSIIDRLPMDLQYSDVSFGRTEEGPSGFFYLTKPTPALANDSPAAYGRTDEVTFSVEGGVKTDAIALEMRCADPNAQIYYTLDSTDPNASSTLYTGPIQISATQVVRAVAVRESYMDSFVHSATYLYGVNHTLPIISIVTDPKNLFDYNTGIMVKGPNATSEHPYGSRNHGANFWMDWEYPAGFEYFDAQGQPVYRQDIGIAIVGQYSRAEDQKSLGLYARARYGHSTFDFNPFPDLDFEQYRTFVLRSSGQDCKYTRMRDAVLTSLAEGTGVYYQEAAPVVVYLNGEYWGHYNLRERINKWSIAQHEGITDKRAIERIDLIKGNSRVLNGSYDSFQEIMEFVKSHSLKDPENLKWVDERVDIDNYLTYVAMEMLVANTDTGNIKFYRVPDGKWKWVFFDLDWAAFDMKYNYVKRYLNDEGHGVRRMFRNDLIMGLLENREVRDRFIVILTKLMDGNFSNENIEKKLLEYKAMIEPEMPAQFERWGSSYESWEKYIANFLKNITGHKVTLMEDLKEYFGLSSADIDEIVSRAANAD